MKRKTHLVINQCVRSSDTVKHRVARMFVLEKRTYTKLRYSYGTEF